MSNDKCVKIREWINTIVAIIGVVFLAYGTIVGVSELKAVNINLGEINSSKVMTPTHYPKSKWY